MKLLSSKMLQNLTYFWNKKTKKIFFDKIFFPDQITTAVFLVALCINHDPEIVFCQYRQSICH